MMWLSDGVVVSSLPKTGRATDQGPRGIPVMMYVTGVWADQVSGLMGPIAVGLRIEAVWFGGRDEQDVLMA
jgi:hypothetical protein